MDDAVDDCFKVGGEVSEDLPTLIGQGDPGCSAVVGVRGSFDQEGLFSSIDHSGYVTGAHE